MKPEKPEIVNELEATFPGTIFIDDDPRTVVTRWYPVTPKRHILYNSEHQVTELCVANGTLQTDNISKKALSDVIDGEHLCTACVKELEKRTDIHVETVYLEDGEELLVREEDGSIRDPDT